MSRPETEKLEKLMKRSKNRYNKRMRTKTKKTLISTVLLSSIPMGLIYNFTGSFNWYPLVFIASFLFLKSPKSALFFSIFSGVSLVSRNFLMEYKLEENLLLGVALGVGIVCTLVSYLVLRKLFSSKFKLNNKTPIMDQIDNIKAGKSSHERGLAFEEFVCDVLKKMGMKAHTTTQLRAKGKTSSLNSKLLWQWWARSGCSSHW